MVAAKGNEKGRAEVPRFGAGVTPEKVGGFSTFTWSERPKYSLLHRTAPHSPL